MEQIAKSKIEELSGIHVRACGLFINKEYPYLAASPDGIIDKDDLIEIKAPYAAKNTMNEVEAVETGKVPIII